VSAPSAPRDQAEWHPNLGVSNLWRLLLAHANSNPLCKRVMAQMPRPLLYVILATLGFRLFYACTLFFAPRAIMNAQTTAFLIYGMQMLSGLWYLLMMLLPMLYARWAYRLTYGQDPNLRSAPFAFADRLMGIVTPFLMAYLVVTGVNIAFNVLQALAFQLIAPGQARGPAALMANALAQIVGILSYLPGMLAFSSFAVSAILRHLVNRTDWSHSPRRSALYIQTPYTIRIVGACCTGAAGTMIGVLPWRFLSPVSGNAPEYYTQLVFAATQFGSLMFQLIVALLLFVVYRSLWRRDLAEARRVLFEPEAGV
jgi:hypothetical protein